MRMKEPYEAYLDDYNCLDVYMSKNFFDGKSRIFHMKDTKDRIIPLTIQSQCDLYNGLFSIFKRKSRDWSRIYSI